MASDSPQIDQWLCVGLALVGGYGDAAGFLVAKTFTGHVTGNLVLVAIDVVGNNWRGTLAHLFAVLTFLSGVFLSVSMIRPLSRSSLRTVMSIEVALMCVASLALASHAARSAELFAFCVALGLGLQNGMVRRTGGISIHTTYLTGMITNLIIAQTNKWFSSADPVAETPEGPALSLAVRVWIAFALGAAVGALTIRHFKDFGGAGAAVLLLGLLLRNAISFPAMRRAYGR